MLVVGDELSGEGPVYLELVHWQSLQVSERRVTRTEIVDGHPHAEASDAVKHLDSSGRIGHHGALGNLNPQILGGYGVHCPQVCGSTREARVPPRACRYN